jgi:hypothetical protein
MSLEQIKANLSECYKEHLPVLLYNDTSNKRNDLILTTHINNGGKTEVVQYIGSEKESAFLDNISSELNKWRNTESTKLTRNSTFRNLISVDKAEKDRIFQIKEKIYNKVRDNFQSTEKTWTYLNGNGKNGESVYRKLINNESWYEVRLPALSIDSKYSAKTREAPVPIQGSFLFDFRGVLFVDNLKCDNNNYKDIENYCNLAGEIKKGSVSVNWLVVYVHNRDNFPESFLKQFELIPLDGEEVVVELVRKKTDSKIRLKIVQNKEEAYWGDNLLPTITDTNFSILLELAKKAGELIENEKLYKLIKSDCNEGVLLNQRIVNIRKVFPSPYNDIKQSKCIIPDAKRNKGYRSLNLTKEQVEII